MPPASAKPPKVYFSLKYALTIIHVCKVNDVGKVVEVVNEMAEQGRRPSSITHAAIIYGMCKHGTNEEARKVVQSMRESRFMTEADLVVFDDMLVDHMKETTVDLVLSGIKFFGPESKLKARLKAKGSTLLSRWKA